MTNLSGLSHFLVVSLSFGHETERRRYCAQHTANVAAPEHLHRTLLDANYRGAATLMALPETANGRRMVLFGYDMGAPEVRRRLRGRSELYDVRLSQCIVMVPGRSSQPLSRSCSGNGTWRRSEWGGKRRDIRQVWCDVSYPHRRRHWRQ